MAKAEQSLDRMCRNFKLDKRPDWVGAVTHDWAPQDLLYGAARMALKAHRLVNVVHIGGPSGRNRPQPPSYLQPSAVEPSHVPSGDGANPTDKAAFGKVGPFSRRRCNACGGCVR